MGADIHFVVEAKPKEHGQWVGVYSTDYTPLMKTRESVADSASYSRTPVFKDRNYRFFADLAGVRGDGPEPLDKPEDASELTEMSLQYWSLDAHSVSYMPLYMFAATRAGQEVVAKALATRVENEGDLTPVYNLPAIKDLVGGYIDSDEAEYRVVFWFDN